MSVRGLAARLGIDQSGLSRIGQLIPTGRPGQVGYFEYAVGPVETSLLSITSGPGGSLWFPAGNTIAQLIPGSQPGQYQLFEYDLGFHPASSLFSITNGPGGTLWFPSGSSISELIPGSRPGLG